HGAWTERAGMQLWRLDRRMTLRFAVAVALLALVSSGVLYTGWSYAQSILFVEHTHQVLHTAEALRSALNNAVSARRGYAMSGDPALAEQFFTALPEADRHYQALERLTARHPGHQQRLGEV